MTVNLDKAISSVTLAGSVLSCLATTCVLTSFAIYHRHLQRFRHVLVLNLVVAGIFKPSVPFCLTELTDRLIRVYQHTKQFHIGSNLPQNWRAEAWGFLYCQWLYWTVFGPSSRLLCTRHCSCYPSNRNTLCIHTDHISDEETHDLRRHLGHASYYEPYPNNRRRDGACWRELVLDLSKSI